MSRKGEKDDVDFGEGFNLLIEKKHNFVEESLNINKPDMKLPIHFSLFDLL